MKRIDKVQQGWDDYYLVDYGEGRKLEYIGGLLCDRPDPQSIGKKIKPTSVWKDVDVYFLWEEKGDRWYTKNKKDDWSCGYENVRLSLFLSGTKHIGIFPEHAHQWGEFSALGKESKKKIRMLNLFGYTGGASIAGASAGFEVTHVDASKTTIETVKKNRTLSKLPDTALRIVCEDALRYVKRLIERGEQFEIIVMDPPAFGRGPKGEVWKIEESLVELLSLIPSLLSTDAHMVLLNGYASGYSALTFGGLLKEVLPNGQVVYGDISIQQKDSERVLSTGIYAKWTA